MSIYRDLSESELIAIVEWAGVDSKWPRKWTVIRFGDHYKAFLGVPRDLETGPDHYWLLARSREHRSLKAALLALVEEIGAFGSEYSNIENENPADVKKYMDAIDWTEGDPDRDIQLRAMELHAQNPDWPAAPRHLRQK